MIAIKRVYEAADPADGTRVLVDRLWPRGLSRESARIDDWLRDIAPSHELRRWYRHDEALWPEFRVRHRRELIDPALVRRLARLHGMAAAGPLTLLYSTRAETRNNATVLCELLQETG